MQGFESLDRLNQLVNQAYRDGEPVRVLVDPGPEVEVVDFEPIQTQPVVNPDTAPVAAGKFPVQWIHPHALNLMGLVAILPSKDREYMYGYRLGEEAFNEIEDRFGITRLNLYRAA